MKIKPKFQRPISIMLIAGFYVFGAIVLLISVLAHTNTVELIADVHGISAVMGKGILPIIAGLALILAYGLMLLSTWGFYLTMAYVCYTGAIGLLRGGLGFITAGDASAQLFFGSILWSVLVMMCLITARRHFFPAGLAGVGW